MSGRTVPSEPPREAYLPVTRSLAPAYAPEIAAKYPQQLEAYKRMPDSVLFRVQQVDIAINEYDLPGPTRRKVTCSRCAQVVRDHREVIKDGRVFCAPCAGGAYFENAREVNWPDMNWTPDKLPVQNCSDNFSRTCETGEDTKIVNSGD